MKNIFNLKVGDHVRFVGDNNQTDRYWDISVFGDGRDPKLKDIVNTVCLVHSIHPADSFYPLRLHMEGKMFVATFHEVLPFMMFKNVKIL